jgi:lipoyl(octanoyl) transferase
MNSPAFRLIVDGAHPGSYNMAFDEALMRSAGEKDFLPVIRFYRWSEPTVSVGYFEDLDLARRIFPGGCGMTMVRRLTGGGNVLHERDLTFSIVSKMPSPIIPQDVKDSYLRINEAVRLGLRMTYPVLDYADCKNTSQRSAQKGRTCFEEPSCFDLLLNGKKVLGASQRRWAGALLHQSTVLIPEEGDSLRDKIVEGFERTWGVAFIPYTPDKNFLEKVSTLEAQRYGDAYWYRTGEKALAGR